MRKESILFVSLLFQALTGPGAEGCQVEERMLKELAEWETFYNFARPHGAFNGKTPYEALRDKL